MLSLRNYKIITKILVILSLAILLNACTIKNPNQQIFEQNKKNFINYIEKNYQIPKSYSSPIMRQAQLKPELIPQVSSPTEQKPWRTYRNYFVKQNRIDLGNAYWTSREDILEAMKNYYGVDPSIIVAIIGVETLYGRDLGNYRALDALATLAFNYPPRSDFFSYELTCFLVLCQQLNIDPLTVKASWAGALGYPQFMPSSYMAYAVSFQNQKPDLFTDNDDVVASIAHYFAEHGWHKNELVAVPAKVSGNSYQQLLNNDYHTRYTVAELAQYGISPSIQLSSTTKVNIIELHTENGKQIWLALNNFYVITSYNHSINYAFAVYQLAEAIKNKHQQQKTSTSDMIMF